MSHVPGTRVGPYEVVAALGAGGMGEVYRAKDTTLGREVALKILPEQFTSDAERVARFKREAQVLASLNHPNIAAIYGVEQNALVMELVEGEDLSVQIARGPITTPDAVSIARQIIDALEAAHEQGIVHRDLKPQNIKVRNDGTVKVLDFGLAKIAEAAEGPDGAERRLTESPTLTARATEMGIILGTASYMSPEQARGRFVDKRTDVWAFGCVLYEMLTGARAFNGEDVTEIISSVMKTDPDVAALPKTVPAHIRTIVGRCLVKDRKARIPDISVVRYMLDDAIASGGETGADRPVLVSRRPSWVWPAATTLLLVTTIAAGGAWYRGRSVEGVNGQFVIAPPDGTTFTSGSYNGATVAAISPDGRVIAFTAQDQAGKRLLFVRAIDALVAQPIAGTEGAAFPFWSPDSKFIGYSITDKVLKVAVAGGPPQPLCTLNPGITSRGGSWSRDGVIIMNNGPNQLSRVPATGGTTCVPMGKLGEGQGGQQFPWFLPDGRSFLFHASGPKGGLYAGALDSDETIRLMDSDTGAVYDAATGRILFVRENTLLSQAFNPATHALSGDAIPIAQKVEAAAQPGVVAFSISETGVLAYGTGEPATAGMRLTWIDRQGKFLGTAGPEASYRGVALSPDGKYLAAHRHDAEGGDIWVIDIARNTPERFTFAPADDNSSPVWSPTGDRIAFQSMRDGKVGVTVKPFHGPGAEVRVFETSTSRMALPTSWRPDGRIVFSLINPKTLTDIWTVATAGQSTALPAIDATFSEFSGQISPDGRWLAYQSNENGRAEIYVQSVAEPSRRWPISTQGGNAPRWRRDNRELFFSGGGKVWAVDIDAKGAELMPGVPKAIMDYRGIVNASHPTPFTSYDVARDGQKFLVTRRDVENEFSTGTAPIVVMLNWRQALRK